MSSEKPMWTIMGSTRRRENLVIAGPVLKPGEFHEVVPAGNRVTLQVLATALRNLSMQVCTQQYADRASDNAEEVLELFVEEQGDILPTYLEGQVSPTLGLVDPGEPVPAKSLRHSDKAARNPRPKRGKVHRLKSLGLNDEVSSNGKRFVYPSCGTKGFWVHDRALTPWMLWTNRLDLNEEVCKTCREVGS